MIRYTVGRNRRVGEESPVSEEATLLVLTGGHTSRYVVRYRFDGSLDAAAIEAAVIEVTGSTP